jgi:hypothetical protein
MGSGPIEASSALNADLLAEDAPKAQTIGRARRQLELHPEAAKYGRGDPGRLPDCRHGHATRVGRERRRWTRPDQFPKPVFRTCPRDGPAVSIQGSKELQHALR